MVRLLLSRVEVRGWEQLLPVGSRPMGRAW